MVTERTSVPSGTSGRTFGRGVALASAVMIGLRASFRLIGFVNTLVLARLLTPSDFGLVAQATAFLAALESLTELAFDAALVRLPVLDRKHLDTAWTFNVLRGLAIGAVLASCARFLAGELYDDRLVPILWLLAAMAVVQGLSNIAVVEFQRTLQFGRIFQYQLFARIAGTIVTITLAFAYRTYWALILGTVVYRLTAVLASYWVQAYRPRFSFAAANELFHFSKWLFVSNILWILESYSMIFISARIGGSKAAGLYQVSYQVAALPASEIAAPIRQPIYAGLAKSIDTPHVLRARFLEGLAILVLAIMPLSAGIGLTAHLVTPLLLGSQWSAAASLIPLCGAYAFFDAVGHYTHNIFLLLNRQKAFVGTFAATLALRLPLLLLGAYAWGLKGALVVLVVTAVLNAVVWLIQAKSLLMFRLREILSAVWRPAVATFAMAGALAAFLPLDVVPTVPVLVLSRFIEVSSLGAGIFVSVELALWRLSGGQNGAEAIMVQLMLGGFRRARGKRLPPEGAKSSNAAP